MNYDFESTRKMKLIVFIKSSILIILICLFSACQNIPAEVEHALKLSGNNRQELQKALDYYQKPEDSLKLKAAYFLIKNMSNKYSVVGKGLEKLDAVFPAIEKARKQNLLIRDPDSDKYPIVDSLWINASMKNGNLVEFYLNAEPDLNTIKSDFLIENHCCPIKKKPNKWLLKNIVF